MLLSKEQTRGPKRCNYNGNRKHAYSLQIYQHLTVNKDTISDLPLTCRTTKSACSILSCLRSIFTASINKLYVSRVNKLICLQASKRTQILSNSVNKLSCEDNRLSPLLTSKEIIPRRVQRNVLIFVHD